ELYTLRSEQYFLPELELDPDELAALQTAVYLLEGQFAYSEPLRLALQNLALGRRGFDDSPTETAVRVDVRDPDYSQETAGRLTKLESAISKQRTVKFTYWTLSRDNTSERTVNPYALFSEQGSWYLIGDDLDRRDRRTFRVSRIRGDIRFATRRERDFRAPETFDPAPYRGRQPWQWGEVEGEAEIELAPETAWWAERMIEHGRMEDGVLHTPYAALPQLAGWVLRQEGRARPLAPPELIDLVAEGLDQVASVHDGEPSKPPRAAPAAREPETLERQAGPVAPERFGLLQSLLAHLLVRCGDEPRATIPAQELVDRFHIPPEQLDEHLQLLNLVNFGGGCYAVYATLDGDQVRVDKELFGDTFRRPPRLTPLEARAIRLALEFVGPMIAAEAHTPLDRVRKKLEETFGQFELRSAPEPETVSEEESLIRTFSRAIEEHRLVEIEYLSAEGDVSERAVEPYSFGRELPYWYVYCWDRLKEAERSFRLDRIRRARLLEERFEPRGGLTLKKLSDVATARVLYSGEAARLKRERGATPLAKGYAITEERFGRSDWLVGEVLSWLGHAEVLEPQDLRRQVHERAKRLRTALFGRTPARARR
ncbi:MAG: WYL domain-containing protein, partial [Gaiellaceae bacterium]